MMKIKKQNIQGSFIRIFALLLCAAFLFGACPLTTFAEETLKEDIFSYTVANGQATITNIEDTRSSVTIPQQLGGYPVVTLATGACGGSSVIEEIVMADSITLIDSMCFAYSTSIRSIVFSKNLAAIGDRAFYQCENLWTVSLPDSLKSIGDEAFALCNRLTAATISQNTTYLGQKVFPTSEHFRVYAKPEAEAAAYAKYYGIGYEELITVTVNGETLVFDQPCITDTQVYRTLVPMRAVLEALGATVTWDELLSTAGINLGDHRILLRPGSPFMMLNGKAHYLTCPAIQFNDRLLLPIRDVIEAVGGKVNWDETTKVVTITWTAPEPKADED